MKNGTKVKRTVDKKWKKKYTPRKRDSNANNNTICGIKYSEINTHQINDRKHEKCHPFIVVISISVCGWCNSIVKDVSSNILVQQKFNKYKKSSGYSSRRSIWHCLYLRRRIFGVILRNRFFHWKVDKIHNNCIWYYDSGETNNILIHQIKLRPFSTNLIVIRCLDC